MSRHLPEVVADFGFVTVYHNSCRGEADEKFDAALSLNGVQIDAVHLQPLDPV